MMVQRSSGLLVGVLIAALTGLYLQISSRHASTGNGPEASLVDEATPARGRVIAGDPTMGDLLVVVAPELLDERNNRVWHALAALARESDGSFPRVSVLPAVDSDESRTTLARWLCADIERKFWSAVEVELGRSHPPVELSYAEAAGIINVPDYLSCSIDGRVQPRINHYRSRFEELHYTEPLPWILQARDSDFILIDLDDALGMFASWRTP